MSSSDSKAPPSSSPSPPPRAPHSSLHSRAPSLPREYSMNSISQMDNKDYKDTHTNTDMNTTSTHDIPPSSSPPLSSSSSSTVSSFSPLQLPTPSPHLLPFSNSNPFGHRLPSPPPTPTHSDLLSHSLVPSAPYCELSSMRMSIPQMAFQQSLENSKNVMNTLIPNNNIGIDMNNDNKSSDSPTTHSLLTDHELSSINSLISPTHHIPPTHFTPINSFVSEYLSFKSENIFMKKYIAECEKIMEEQKGKGGDRKSSDVHIDMNNSEDHAPPVSVLQDIPLSSRLFSNYEYRLSLAYEKEKSYDNLKKSHDEMTHKVAEYEEKQHKLNENIVELTTKNRNLQSELSILRDQNTDHYALHRELLEEKNGNERERSLLGVLKEEKAKNIVEMEYLKSENGVLERNYNEMYKIFLSLESKYNEKENEINMHRTREQSLLAQITSSNGELQSMSAKYSEEKSDRQKYQQELLTLTDHMNGKMNVQYYENEIREMEDKISSMNKSHQEDIYLIMKEKNAMDVERREEERKRKGMERIYEEMKGKYEGFYREKDEKMMKMMENEKEIQGKYLFEKEEWKNVKDQLDHIITVKNAESALREKELHDLQSHVKENYIAERKVIEEKYQQLWDNFNKEKEISHGKYTEYERKISDLLNEITHTKTTHEMTNHQHSIVEKKYQEEISSLTTLLTTLQTSYHHDLAHLTTQHNTTQSTTLSHLSHSQSLYQHSLLTIAEMESLVSELRTQRDKAGEMERTMEREKTIGVQREKMMAEKEERMEREYGEIRDKNEYLVKENAHCKSIISFLEKDLISHKLKMERAEKKISYWAEWIDKRNKFIMSNENDLYQYREGGKRHSHSLAEGKENNDDNVEKFISEMEMNIGRSPSKRKTFNIHRGVTFSNSEESSLPATVVKERMQRDPHHEQWSATMIREGNGIERELQME